MKENVKLVSTAEGKWSILTVYRTFLPSLMGTLTHGQTKRGEKAAVFRSVYLCTTKKVKDLFIDPSELVAIALRVDMGFLWTKK